MQISKIQSISAFNGWASKNSNSNTIPKQELSFAIAKTAETKGDEVAEKCLALAKKLDEDKLYNLEFSTTGRKGTKYVVKATSTSQLAKNSTFKTGIFSNRNLLNLLTRVDKFVNKQNKKVDKQTDFFRIDLGDTDFTEVVEILRKDLG